MSVGNGDYGIVNGNSDSIYAGIGSSLYLTGASDSIFANNDLLGLGPATSATVFGNGNAIGIGGNGDALSTSGNSVSIGNGDYAVLNGNSNGIYVGIGSSLYLTGTSDSITASNDLLGLGPATSASVTGTGNAIGVAGNGDTLTTSGNSISIGDGDYGVVNGNANGIYVGIGSSLCITGTSDSITANNDLIGLGAATSVNVAGDANWIETAASGDSISLSGNADTATINNALITLDNGNTSVTVEGGNDTVTSGSSGDTVGFTGAGDTAAFSNGQIYANDTSASSLAVTGSGDAQTDIAGRTQSNPVLDSATIDDIDALYNAVLDRDAAPSDLVAAQVYLAGGGSLNGLMSQVAGSAEALADMTSTYAAVASGTNLALLDAQPQSNFEPPADDGVPTATEFGDFARAMSTAYGAPIELYSIDPATGAEVVLADTSVTNLLAELPVLETQANGVTLGLQLADGAPQVQFASTAGLATFLYAVAVQQGQATSFVTDNYNLDMQWLNTVDQPLLQEAVFWTERAQGETAAGQTERAIEDNTQASMALQIAAEAPGARQDMSVTINNAATGNPTQITVYADGDGSTIHDVAPSAFSYVESAVSTVLNIAAAVTGQAYLYFAAAAIDAAEAGQDLSNGEDVQGILSLAQAVAAGINGGAGGTTPLGTTPAAPLTSAQVTAQIINTAVQGVGGVYGVVQSAENGNALGILAGALEAAAAGATGVGIVSSAQTQATLNAIAAGLSTAGIVTTVAGDFASGNLGQGLLDSLNLYLPAVAQAFANDQSNQSNPSAPLQMSEAAFVAAENAGVNAGLTNSGGLIADLPASTEVPADAPSSTVTSQGQTSTVTLVPIEIVSAGQSSSTASQSAIGIEVQPAASNASDGSTPPNIVTLQQSDYYLQQIQFLFGAATSDNGGSTNATLPSVNQFDQATAKNGPAGGLALFENSLNLTPSPADPSVYNTVAEGYHAYVVQGSQGYATAQAAFQDLLNKPAGWWLWLGSGSPGTLVQSGQVTNLPIVGPITTYVDPNDMTIFNVTMPTHLLNPGLVERSVELGSDGLYHINTYGEGNGIVPGINDNAAGIIFGGAATSLH